jgi:hypothetical protein
LFSIIRIVYLLLDNSHPKEGVLMKLVDTETPNPDRFARTPDGKIDFDAYRGCSASYRSGELDFEVTIIESRQRFGHLDLLITPKAGSGQRWTEFKNLSIHNDPALNVAVIAATPSVVIPSPEIEPEPVVEIPISAPAPAPSGHGTHWTEIAPVVDEDQSEVATISVATDLEDEVASMLGHVQLKD